MGNTNIDFMDEDFRAYIAIVITKDITIDDHPVVLIEDVMSKSILGIIIHGILISIG